MVVTKMVRHGTALAGRGRSALVGRWRRVVRATATCAGAAAVIALVFVVPPTIASTVADLAHARGAGLSGDLDPHGSLRHVGEALQATGNVGLAHPWWLVSWSSAGELVMDGNSRAFVDEAAARRFVERVDGSVVTSAALTTHDGSAVVYPRDASVITDEEGRPVVEIVTASGRLLYRSPGVPVEAGHPGPITPNTVGIEDGSSIPTGSRGWWAGSPSAGAGGPDTAVCAQVDPTYWKFGEGVLRGVEPPTDGEPARVCVFRTAAQVRAAQLDVVRWALVRAGDSFVGYWAMALPVVAIGGLVVGRFRRRVGRAARADTPVLMDNPRPRGVLGGITEEVNHSLSRARLSVEQQRAFVADAAHELRSPLTSLITTLEVADRHPGIVDPQQQVTRTSLIQARRLERLTQDLLLLAQLDARARLREDVVDLADVIGEVVDDTPDQGRPVRLTGATPAHVIGDRDAFRRVLRNLVDNAVRHAATEVEVRMSTADGRGRVEVANDGAPIPDERAEQIFDRFTRLDDARSRDAGGSGLGLAIARGVTERYGGTVTLMPGRTDGATFVWELPAAR